MKFAIQNGGSNRFVFFWPRRQFSLQPMKPTLKNNLKNYKHIDYSSEFDHYRSSILSGTYVIDVDLNTLTARKIQSSIPSQNILTEEKIFVYKNDVFMVVYKIIWLFQYLFLYKWLNESWVTMNFQTDNTEFMIYHYRIEVHITQSDSDTVIFTTSLLGGNTVIFSKFTEKDEDFSYMVTHLYAIHELPLPSSHVLFTGLKGENLSSIMEMDHGTYHWVPDKIIEVNPNNESFVQIDIQGKVPNWDFSGPKHVFQSKDKLLLADGSELINIVQYNQTRDIWILNLSHYSYTQLPLQLPEEAMSYKMCAAFDVEKSIYYVIDVDSGIYRVNLTRWLA
ncbi:Kelch domain-containing protein [Trichinella spiralis]|uniref:Kelch domain-containing protein n=1 Tax=Trichinella spiralis TaxID=6334 RepID=A0ABR3KB34_TRISP